uniref:Uncharacterized protein n=1 Tax=Caenorhabditis japonica TaxID=281687 RepID=A0A8R1IBN3_CAEJA
MEQFYNSIQQIPQKLREFQCGDRVLISEINPAHAQKRNLYSQLFWTKTHLALLGHVGYVIAVNEQKKTALVRVYYAMPPGTELYHTLTEWTFDGLEHPHTVEHSKGDLVAITRGNPNKTTIGVIAGKDLVNFGGVPKYLVYLKRAANSPQLRDIQVTIDANPGWTDGRRDLFLCPVYTGARFSMVMRDRHEHAIHTYKQASVICGAK